MSARWTTRTKRFQVRANQNPPAAALHHSILRFGILSNWSNWLALVFTCAIRGRPRRNVVKSTRVGSGDALSANQWSALLLAVAGRWSFALITSPLQSTTWDDTQSGQENRFRWTRSMWLASQSTIAFHHRNSPFRTLMMMLHNG